MARVEISKAADADLAAILEYSTMTFGRETAEAYLESFQSVLALLAEHPRAGIVHSEIDPPIYSLPNRSHRVYYDLEGDRVIVQRVLHKAMDAGKWLR